MSLVKYPHRKQLRLAGYDYSRAGAYFVTICTKNRENYFGQIINQTVILGRLGEIVNACLLEMPNHFLNVSLDEYRHRIPNLH